jgi:hypothetical protein
MLSRLGHQICTPTPKSPTLSGAPRNSPSSLQLANLPIRVRSSGVPIAVAQLPSYLGYCYLLFTGENVNCGMDSEVSVGDVIKAERFSMFRRFQTKRYGGQELVLGTNQEQQLFSPRYTVIIPPQWKQQAVHTSTPSPTAAPSKASPSQPPNPPPTCATTSAASAMHFPHYNAGAVLVDSRRRSHTAAKRHPVDVTAGPGCVRNLGS